jgi:KDO2-lipid IV(A) lauroyltransferase
VSGARNSWQRVRDRSVDVGYGAAWRIGRALPQRPVLAVAGRFAERAQRKDGRGVRQLRANLRRVLGPDADPAQVEDAVRRALRSYARYWVETFRLPRIPAAEVVAHTAAEGFENIEHAAAAGRGVILALPHAGNWETAGVFLMSQGYPFTTVAERLKPEALFRRFVEFREGLGMRILPLTGGPPTAPALAEVLTEGGVICLLGDRSFGPSGVEVSLFGEPAVLPAGPAMLAARTGAALLSVGCWFTPDGWGIRVSGPIAADGVGLAQHTRALTQALATNFEEHLREHPADWHMLQPVWAADRRR